MKILHVIESLALGGAEVALIALAKAQVALGHEVAVCALEATMPLAQQASGSGIEFLSLGALRSANPLPKLRAFRKIVARIGPDVIHSHLLHADLLVAMAGAEAGAKRPLRVTTLHNLIYDAHPVDSARRRIQRAIYAFALRRGFDRRIAVSGAVAGHFARHCGIPGPAVIFNAVESSTGDPSSRAELSGRFGLDPGCRWLINPARLVVEKGQDTLIAAVSKLAERHPDIQLLIVGGGPLEANLRQMAERSGAPVHLLGNVDNATLRALIREAAIGTLPSRSEGLPVALVEMMMAGLPVAASAVGGIPELIEDGITGILVAPDDVQGLTEALERIAGDSVLASELGERARALAESRCKPAMVAKQVMQVYRA